jgi:hypothetical protein
MVILYFFSLTPSPSPMERGAELNSPPFLRRVMRFMILDLRIVEHFISVVGVRTIAIRQTVFTLYLNHNYLIIKY